jgi:carbon starvation protein
MSLLLFLVASGIILALAYRWMGGFLIRHFKLDGAAAVPSHAQRDGLDFEPAKTSYLLPQHFSAIAAAGPVVGPILAATLFGWLPAWIWIIAGAILIGGVHDFSALVASVRHQGRSIAEVVGRYMNHRSYLLFLAFIWISLIYVIIAFADVTAAHHPSCRSRRLRSAGPAVATLLDSLLVGSRDHDGTVVVRRTKLGENRAKLIFLRSSWARFCWSYHPFASAHSPA